MKIKNTPPLTADSLCQSCKYSGKLKGRQFNQEYVYCSIFEKMIGMHVTECSNWHDAKEPTAYEYNQSAWIMFEGKFYSPTEVRGLRSKGQWRAD